MASVTSEHLANVKDMFTTCFGYSPYEVQTQVIAEAFYTKTDQVVVQATGGGKSAIPLGVLRMAGGVGVVVVPLQTIGSNQASLAQKCARILQLTTGTRWLLERRQSSFRICQS